MVQVKALSIEIELLNSEIIQLEEELTKQKPKKRDTKNPHYFNFSKRIKSFDPFKYQKCIECLLLKGKYPEIHDINGCICAHQLSLIEAGNSEEGGHCICNGDDVSIYR